MIVFHTVVFALCLFGVYITARDGNPLLCTLNVLCSGFNLGMIIVYILQVVNG